MTFSEPAEDYASHVSSWYGVKSDDPSEINLKRRNQKIADVLSRFGIKLPKPASKQAGSVPN